MFDSFKYYLNKLISFCKKNFNYRRVKSFGILIPILRFIVFLGHRSNYFLIKKVERLHDEMVNEYILRKYKDVFDKYLEKDIL